MSALNQRVRTDQSRSTGNRRAVRNALFRELMERPRTKLHEWELIRARTTFGPPLRVDPLDMSHWQNPCEMSVPPEPAPHPLLRWWRRILWGE